jgi:broad specificity polyphosphatase/5'/3'-nucleotidase SurE
LSGGRGEGRSGDRAGADDPWLSIDERKDGRGFPYFWLKFGRRDFAPDAESDIKAISNGYVSVTPLKLDLTNHAVQDQIAKPRWKPEW